jgi:hypothetical protein
LKSSNQRLLNPPPHLDDVTLVAYLDGELPRSEMDEMHSHLESCWACRSRAAEVQSNIDSFLRARETLLPDSSILSESRVEQFRQRLARHAMAAEAQPPSLRERFTHWGGRLGARFSVLLQHRQALVASLVVLCILLAMFTDSLNTRVSADTVLIRAEKFEANQNPLPGNVVRTSIRVNRVDHKNTGGREIGTITLIHDSASSAIYVRGQSASGEVHGAVQDVRQMAKPLLNVLFSRDETKTPVVQYLISQRWVPDASVAEFRRMAGWGSGGNFSAQRKDGAFELQYPFGPNHPSGIAEARLRVDARNYAVNDLSIIAYGDDSEYRFTRTTYSAEPRTPEIARLFAPAEALRAESSTARSLPGLPKPTPLSYANSHASEGEVAIAGALHQVDACLGEEVYLFPMSDSSLLVQGLVDSSARRDAIRQALKSADVPLRIEVYIPRELKNGSELYNSPDSSALNSSGDSNSSTTLADLSGASMPLHETLYAHFYKPGASAEDVNKQVALFSNEIVTLARQTFLHAWALRRLDHEFSPERTAGLSASSLEKIERMRRDHDRWISTVTHRQSEMLSPIAGTEVSSDLEQAIVGRENSDTLLRLAQEQNDLVRSLFTTSQRPSEPAVSLTRLMVLLRRLGS